MFVYHCDAEDVPDAADAWLDKQLVSKMSLQNWPPH